MKTKQTPLLIIILCLFCAATLSAHERSLRSHRRTSQKTPGIVIEKIDNDKADFAVMVKLDHDNASYVENELITITVESSRSGYLYLVHISSTGEETLLIPNEFQADNLIEAKTVVHFPAEDADFQFRVTGPNFGRETIKAFVTDRKLKSIDAKKFTKAPVTALDENETKENEIKYAIHQVGYTTRAKDAPAVTAEPRRFAVCFGVNKYSDPSIKTLSASVNDAKLYAEMLNKYCGVAEEDCLVLTDEEVTLETVKKIFCEVLPKVVPPGSEVFLYWSGYGDRMVSTREDNSMKGFASYLAPHDGMTSDPENTMLLGGPFGQWVQNLNNCRLFFVIDACHSGGMASQAKSIDSEKSEVSLLEIAEETTADQESIFDDEDFTDFSFGSQCIAQSKALGQEGLAVLASSSYDQLSWEREEGDFSVMTFCLVEAVLEGPKDMTHKDLQSKVGDAVNEYLKASRPYVRQTVVVQDELNPGLILKP